MFPAGSFARCPHGGVHPESSRTRIVTNLSAVAAYARHWGLYRDGDRILAGLISGTVVGDATDLVNETRGMFVEVWSGGVVYLRPAGGDAS